MSDLLIDLKQIEFDPKIRGVVHVGAHKAEEYETYVTLGADKIIYIEGNRELIGDLVKRFEGNYNVCLIEAVISDKEEDVVFKIHNDTHTSSILDMAKIAETHPELYVKREDKVRTISLNKLFSDLKADLSGYNFLTIDVQGVELQALRGLGEYIKYFDYIYTEVETWELYKGAQNYEGIQKWFKENNFEMMTEHIRHWGWGDVLYKRKGI